MAIRDDVDEMIEFLDTLAKMDPVGMGKLIAARVPCNQTLAEHPTVQVGAGREFGKPEEGWMVGVLGILNGFYGRFEGGDWDGAGPIAATLDVYGRCVGFRRTDSVVRTGRH
jgi:hypothetical protein